MGYVGRVDGSVGFRKGDRKLCGDNRGAVYQLAESVDRVLLVSACWGGRIRVSLVFEIFHNVEHGTWIADISPLTLLLFSSRSGT